MHDKSFHLCSHPLNTRIWEEGAPEPAFLQAEPLSPLPQEFYSPFPALFCALDTLQPLKVSAVRWGPALEVPQQCHLRGQALPWACAHAGADTSQVPVASCSPGHTWAHVQPHTCLGPSPATQSLCPVPGAFHGVGVTILPGLCLSQVFVETLDKCFENVCELDLIFHMDKVHHILQEMVIGGMVLETNMNEIVAQVEAQGKLEKAEGGLSAAPSRAVSAVKNINLPEIPRNINIGDINIKVPNLSQFM
uniref:AP complex mu/sigma subunit domain-containing protein n=1 Tax=Zonotrichia albicollis TaxID=44394 RepID=A0A8D2MPQ5_ZONAL